MNVIIGVFVVIALMYVVVFLAQRPLCHTKQSKRDNYPPHD